jgi:hypothetical protein
MRGTNVVEAKVNNTGGHKLKDQEWRNFSMAMRIFRSEVSAHSDRL